MSNETKASAIEKCVDMSSAIEDIGVINNKLERLIDEIQGTDSDKCADDSGAHITLAYVLNNGPQMIREKINKAEEQIDNLRSLLY